MPEWWLVGVAVYAAIVATGALFLEIRRWFEGRPRLSIRVTQGMQTVNVPQAEGNRYLMVTAVNRGSMSTTLTTLALLEYPSWWRRLRGRPGPAAVVAIPSIPGTETGRLPHVLDPGGQWSGAALEDEKLREWVGAGRLYVAVYASHSDRPALKHVRPKPATPKSLEGAEQR